MFPPETMQTTRALSSEPGERGGDGEPGGALADDPRALGERAHGGGSVRERRSRRRR